MMPMPRRWGGSDALAVWQWFGSARAPLPVMVAGAEGGVGTSLVAALLAEAIAAASPGPTVAVDQSGAPWGAMTRRLLSERAGMPGQTVQQLLGQRHAAGRIGEALPTSPAGAGVVADAWAYTPIRTLFTLAAATCGALVCDSGRVDVVLPARMDPVPLLVLVGRADVVGAEAMCAVLSFLRGLRQAVPAPVVVLSSTAPSNPRKVRAARRLVRASGLGAPLIHLPYDERMAAAQPLPLDELPKPVISACVQLLRAVARNRSGEWT